MNFEQMNEIEKKKFYELMNEARKERIKKVVKRYSNRSYEILSAVYFKQRVGSITCGDFKPSTMTRDEYALRMMEMTRDHVNDNIRRLKVLLSKSAKYVRDVKIRDGFLIGTPQFRKDVSFNPSIEYTSFTFVRTIRAELKALVSVLHAVDHNIKTLKRNIKIEKMIKRNVLSPNF